MTTLSSSPQATSMQNGQVLSIQRGNEAFVLYDQNNNGVYDKGDQLYFVSKDHARLIEDESGRNHASSMEDDPHKYDLAYTDAQVADKDSKVAALWSAAKDGSTDSTSFSKLFDSARDSLTSGTKTIEHHFHSERLAFNQQDRDQTIQVATATEVSGGTAKWTAGKAAYVQTAELELNKGKISIQIDNIWQGGDLTVKDLTNNQAAEKIKDGASLADGGVLATVTENAGWDRYQGFALDNGVTVFNNQNGIAATLNMRTTESVAQSDAADAEDTKARWSQIAKQNASLGAVDLGDDDDDDDDEVETDTVDTTKAVAA